jgi:hypothetical protein
VVLGQGVKVLVTLTRPQFGVGCCNLQHHYTTVLDLGREFSLGFFCTQEETHG